MRMSPGARLALAAICGVTGGTPAMAQNVDCEPVGRTIVFCYPPGIWRPVDDNQPDSIGSFTGHGGMAGYYAQFFVDEGGAAAGQTLDGLQEMLIAGITGGAAEMEVPVIETVETEYRDAPARRIVLAPPAGSGTAMVTATVVVRAEESLRLVTTTLAESYSPEIGRMHEVFLDEIRLVNPNG
jgi:hypothetical protein